MLSVINLRGSVFIFQPNYILVVYVKVWNKKKIGYEVNFRFLIIWPYLVHTN